jgi:hypothetical protein
MVIARQSLWRPAGGSSSANPDRLAQDLDVADVTDPDGEQIVPAAQPVKLR